MIGHRSDPQAAAEASGEIPPPAVLSTLSTEDRVRLGTAGLRTVLRIADVWGLSQEELGNVLGEVTPATIEAWRREVPAAASTYSPELLTRLSAILGIYGALQRLWPGSSFADAWPTAPNAAVPFDGRTPIDVMIGRGIPGLMLVLRLLESDAAGGITVAAPGAERESRTSA